MVCFQIWFEGIPNMTWPDLTWPDLPYLSTVHPIPYAHLSSILPFHDLFPVPWRPVKILLQYLCCVVAVLILFYFCPVPYLFLYGSRHNIVLVQSHLPRMFPSVQSRIHVLFCSAPVPFISCNHFAVLFLFWSCVIPVPFLTYSCPVQATIMPWSSSFPSCLCSLLFSPGLPLYDHYTTLHYTTLHYTTLHYTTSTLHCHYTNTTLPHYHYHYTPYHNYYDYHYHYHYY